jgi:hypothetical protein
MDRLKRTQSVQYYGQLASKSVEKQADAAKEEDVAATDDRKVSIPLSLVPGSVVGTHSVAVAVPQSPTVNSPRNEVPEDALETRSAVVAVPQSTTVNPPRCCLELTVGNAANLKEDEIVQLLRFRRWFDVSKFAPILFLPDGYQIAIQLVNGMSGNCLLKAIGSSNVSADNFTYMFPPENYFDKNMTDTPTKEEMMELLAVECSPLPDNLPEEEFDKLATVVGQDMMDTYSDKSRREKFVDNLGKIVDLIFHKLPSRSADNQVYWDNICEAVTEETVGEDGEYSEEKLQELTEKYPAFKAAHAAWKAAREAEA